ncbi:Fe-S cluster assembly iron-binding protein IscA [Halopolyspora algeriensis]|uniref:Fe-S cluster assembly iron-binding protein IscA n=1 Tax=Halopolyspora algeriensis TaxID=1500506 RepID=A0A368VGF9_9ACTN|nr:HesB/YadR/YfhF-family protein [Halopolyspora algeriensis]RCW38764.1 Fe-S cluster assembly iron-binding protein IscA [Halopolyspora algeriensis]TQM55739.1 Fe-S cluster assembly iron-binding protein IscA [Halopolyspora algeriensis]
MLTISEDAAEVIKVVLAGSESSEGGGLRIASPEGGDADQGLLASVVAEPEGSDEVVEAEGVRVFLDPQASSVLGDKTLDAERDDNGELGLTVRE